MKKQLYRRIFAAMLVMTTVGCGRNGDTATVETTGEANQTETITPETETESLDPMIEAVDCNGQTFTILGRLSTGDYRYPYEEFLAEELNGETINDAIFTRNGFVMGKYNIVIDPVSVDNVGTVAGKAVLANDGAYDMITPSHNDAYSMTVNGYLTNFDTISHVDETKPYWMSSLLKNISVDGKHYFLTGDLNLSALNGVGIIYFNKDLAAEVGLNDLYDTVKAGEWTLDTFQTACKGVSLDVNGDGALGLEDRFGLTTNGFAWQPFLSGSNASLLALDDNQQLTFQWDSETNVGMIERVITLLNDRESTILMNQYPELSDIGQASIDMFRENRALFWIEIIYGALEQRDMEADFGFLPMPKFDETQQEYTSYMHMGHTNTCAIPKTNPELDLAGRLLEDMAYQSSLTVRPAYYDVTLQGKVSRDDDSGEMLDIIYANINLDPAVIMAGLLPVDTEMRQFMIKNNTEFMSTIAAQKQKCEATLAEINEKITSQP